MPAEFGFKLNAAVYTTLMSSCTWNHRLDLALKLHGRMLQDPGRAQIWIDFQLRDVTFM